MSSRRNWLRFDRQRKAARADMDAKAWGLHQRDKATATLGSPKPPTKAELRQQATEAWEEVQRRSMVPR
jgi:hypothetical protein